ncbi:MAG: phospholipid carrier-dependent glycosyltransferase [Chloroflexi bacterium]|nr:phospholipid carrier-dependent glycosyltransferase [Chloroflexota bacterium]
MTGRLGEGETRREGEREKKSPALPLSLSPPLIWITLALTIVVAAAFRFYGLAWDGGYLFHPDERKILLVAAELRLPANAFEFFSTDSPLNPKFFAYGSFPIYLLKILSVFAPTPALAVPWREDFVGLALLGRALSALFDLGAIALTFLLARRLYDATTGLIASACIAVTVLHIQLSHFYAVDTLLTLLVVATMYFAARFAQDRKRRDAIATGIAFGLALATKVTALPLVVPIVVAVVKTNGREGEWESGRNSSPSLPVSLSPALPLRNWLTQLWSTRVTLGGILAVALAAFIVTQPYALLDPVRYFGQIGTESLVARGWLDYPYTRQYADTLPFVYPIVQSSIWGMGLPLGIFAWLGSALFAWRWWRERGRALSGVEGWRDGFILAWALIYFLIVGAQYAKYLRYLLPLTPFLFLMAASAFKVQSSRFKVSGFRLQVSHFGHHASRLLSTVYGLLLTVSLAYAFAFTSLYSREHPWLTISKWIYASVPPNATIVIEYWDDALPVPMRVGDATREPGEYTTITLPMYDDDNAAKLETIVNTLRDADCIILATQRLSAPITRLSQRYPIASRYYRALFDGQLGFELAASAANGIALDGLVIADDRFDGRAPPFFSASDARVWNWGRADESFTVYDHPLPLVFKKTRALSRDELRARLSP